MDGGNRQKLIKSILVFIGVLVTGIVGYMLIEGWHLIDAAFMTVITLGTVGYGETYPLSPEGRIFTIFLIVFGLGAAASVLNSFANILLETKLDHFLGRKVMYAELKRMKDHVILCGFGQMGTIIAFRLKEEQIPFVIIEEDESEIERAKQMGFIYVQGSIVADTSLMLAGVERAKTMVACISDLTTNLTLALAAKELNPNIEFIAQGVERAFESRIIRAGADAVVYPMALGGEQISELVTKRYQGVIAEDRVGAYRIDGFYLKLYRHFSDNPLTIADALARERGIRAVSWRSGSTPNVVDPDNGITLSKGDSIVILMNEQINPRLEDLPHLTKVPKIIWNESYSVGVPMIDEEHLRLINLINQFNESLMEEKSQEVLIKTFDQLIAYSLEHFRNEEALMLQRRYPDLEAHILEHQRLMQTVMDLNQEKRYIFPASVSEFMNMWLIDHILACDKLYVDYLKD